MLAGVVAASSLVRRQNTDDELRLAEARVVRSETAMDRLRQKLLDNASSVAAEIAPIRSADDIEKRLGDWITAAVSSTADETKGEGRTAPKNKTSFV